MINGTPGSSTVTVGNNILNAEAEANKTAIKNAEEDDAQKKKLKKAASALALETRRIAIEEQRKQSRIAQRKAIAAQKESNNELKALEDSDFNIKKANRLWYDVSKWSRSELIARGWFGFLYAVLCGISIFASILALGLPIGMVDQIIIASLGASVTFTINLSGLWDNITSLFEEKHQKDGLEGLAGGTLLAYNIFCNTLLLTASVLSTGLALSTVTVSLGMASLSYWATVPVLLLFGTTLYALQGLFTQQPRKWFFGIQEDGLKQSLKNSAKYIWFGGADPTENTITLSSKISRTILFVLFSVAITVASVLVAPYAGEVTLFLMAQFFTGNGAGLGAFMASPTAAAISWTMGGLFIAGLTPYAVSLSAQLCKLGTNFLGKCADTWSEPVKNYSPLMNALLALTVVVPLYCTLRMLTVGAWSLAKSEYSCWSEARVYADKQYYKKDAWFFWPHFFLRVLYNHKPVWGAINAVNNGALTTYGKFEGETLVLNELTNKEIFDASFSGIVGFLRSYGFFRLTKEPRDIELANIEEKMTLEVQPKEKPYFYSMFWSRPEEEKSDFVPSSSPAQTPTI